MAGSRPSYLQCIAFFPLTSRAKNVQVALSPQRPLAKGDSLLPATWRLLASLRNPPAGRWATKHPNPSEKTMKTRLFVVAGVAISFAIPAFAQQKEAVDPQSAEPQSAELEQAEKTAVDHALRDYNDAFGRGDLSAIGQHCDVPFVRISSQGVKVCATMSEIEALYGGIQRDLRERGYSHST